MKYRIKCVFITNKNICLLSGYSKYFPGKWLSDTTDNYRRPIRHLALPIMTASVAPFPLFYFFHLNFLNIN